MNFDCEAMTIALAICCWLGLQIVSPKITDMRFGRKKIQEEEKWLMGISIALGATVLALGIATLLMGRRQGGKPSKKAPQLHLDNPGTQADFPTSATESEVG